MKTYSINEIIEMAVQIEKSGYSFYDKALYNKSLSNKAKELIIYLRDEEKKHEKIFKRLRDKIDLSEIDKSQDWKTVSSYMRAIIESRIFNTPEAAIKLATEAEKETDIIDYAIQFEKDTLLYFHSVNMVVNEAKSKKAIKEIIDEEVSHVLRLSEIKEELTK